MNTKQRSPRYVDTVTNDSSNDNGLDTHIHRQLPPLVALAICTALVSFVALPEASAQVPPAQPPAANSPGSWQMPASTQPRPSPPPPAPAYAPPPPAQQPVAYAPPAPYYPPRVAEAPPEPPDQVEDEDDDPPYFDVMIGTQVPLSMGALLSLELPGRLLLQGELGWMPAAYGSAINGVVQGFGAYDRDVAALIDASLEDALVARLSAGWRPFPSAGFEIFGGYTHVALSGSVSPAAVAGVVGGPFAQQVAGELLSEDVAISSALHNFHVGLGWRWVAFDHLVIRLSAAYTQTLGSSSSIETPELPEAAAQANPLIDETLSEVYTEYVKLPVVGLNAGYRF